MPTIVHRAAPSRRRTRTLGHAFATFTEGNLKHTKGPKAKLPFVLEPWQRDDWNLILELDSKGRRRWLRVMYEMPRGCGKSPTVGAALHLEAHSRDDQPEIYGAAPSKDGAGIVHGFAKDMIKDGPLEDYVTTGRAKLSPILIPATNGSITVLAGDGDMQHGLIPSATAIDEPHAFRTRKQEELYYALSSAMQKRTDAVEYLISTAGWDFGTLFGEKHQAALERSDLEVFDDGFRVVGRRPDTNSLFIYRGAPDEAMAKLLGVPATDPHDPATWRRATPASWITDQALRILAGELPLDVFRRLILNQWTESESSVFSAPQWDACVASSTFERGMPVWMGVRMDERRENAALAICGRLPNDRRLLRCTVWEGEDADALPGKVEKWIRDWAEVLDVRCLAYDPWQTRTLASSLDGVVPMYRGQKGTQAPGMPWTDGWRVPGSQLFFELVTQKRVDHDGSDELRRHVLGCSAHASTTSRSAWYIGPPAPRRDGTVKPVQAAQASVMALLACEENAGGRRGFTTAW